jgi:DNA-directed RNA polymerase III subunit RPC2
VMSQFTNQFGNLTSTQHGALVSSILVTGAIASFFGGRLADVLGRGLAVSLGGFIFGIGAALEAAAMHIAMFTVGRVIAGVGEGFFLSTMVVYGIPVDFHILWQ